MKKQDEKKNSYENAVFRGAKSEIEATIFSKEWSFKRMMPPMLSRAMCDDAVKTLSCSSSENSPEKPPIKSPKKIRKKRMSKTPKASEASDVSGEKLEKNDLAEKSPNFLANEERKETPRRFTNIGFVSKSVSTPDPGPKNLRRLSKDYSPKNR